jgi:hypothetical protein
VAEADRWKAVDYDRIEKLLCRYLGVKFVAGDLPTLIEIELRHLKTLLVAGEVDGEVFSVAEFRERREIVAELVDKFLGDRSTGILTFSVRRSDIAETSNG